jgi:penicillin-binding protein-related factor A (putative recombinase)
MQNTGKPSEDIFEENMKALGAHVYRFEDHADVNKSRVRKRIVSSKPSDYLVTEKGLTAYAEVKSIAESPRFDFSRIEKRQWREATKVTKAGGLYYFYLHFISIDGWFKVPASLLLSWPKKSMRFDELTRFQFTWG